MADRILEIGRRGLETTDEKVKAMMNNIVNAQTPGFRKTDLQITSFPAALEKAKNKVEGEPSAMLPKVAGVYQDKTHGALLRTGSATDLAVAGDGYFVLQGSAGELFTRDGRFTLDENGVLTSVAGKNPVMGQGGPIAVIPGSRVDITQDGDVKSDGVAIDRIRIVKFEDQSKLESINNVMFKLPENGGAHYTVDENPRVLQGYTEASNVNIMDEMMQMIYLQRIYGMDAKIVQTRDASLSRSLEMGRPSQ
ncbi:MAG: flagellar hook basal-body protein [Candidatus Margulisiibacteriota bacterium]